MREFVDPALISILAVVSHSDEGSFDYRVLYNNVQVSPFFCVFGCVMLRKYVTSATLLCVAKGGHQKNLLH